jgi:hypothetical protein
MPGLVGLLSCLINILIWYLIIYCIGWIILYVIGLLGVPVPPKAPTIFMAILGLIALLMLLLCLLGGSSPMEGYMFFGGHNHYAVGRVP